jgi:hypothetical protein
MSLVLGRARLSHAAAIGENLRAGDWAELQALGYTRGTDACEACINDCPESITCLEDGVPIAAWGHKPDPMLLSGTALLWCLTTPAVERHKKSILRFSRAWCAELLESFYRLESTTSPIYPQAVRWTSWLGFRPISSITINGVEFNVIEKLRG